MQLNQLPGGNLVITQHEELKWIIERDLINILAFNVLPPPSTPFHKQPKPIFLLNPNCDMSLSFFHSILRAAASRWPMFLYGATWTLLLSFTVAVASISPEIAFVTAISPSSPFSKSCAGDGFVRIPLDHPREAMCFPAGMVRRSNLDFFVPTVFAAMIVAGSAFVVRSFTLWEGERCRELGHDLVVAATL